MTEKQTFPFDHINFPRLVQREVAEQFYQKYHGLVEVVKIEVEDDDSVQIYIRYDEVTLYLNFNTENDEVALARLEYTSIVNSDYNSSLLKTYPQIFDKMKTIATQLEGENQNEKEERAFISAFLSSCQEIKEATKNLEQNWKHHENKRKIRREISELIERREKNKTTHLVEYLRLPIHQLTEDELEQIKIILSRGQHEQ